MEYFLHPLATGLGFLTQVVEGESPTEDLVDQAGEVAGVAPWTPTDTTRAALPLLLGRVADLDAAQALLGGLLGGTATTPAEGVMCVRWAQGADLMLTHAVEGLGVHTLVFGPAGRAWTRRDLTAAFEDGRFDPALGIHVTELEHVTSPACC